VATTTEIYDFLRVLFARVGVPHCPKCGQRIFRRTVDQIKVSWTQDADASPTATPVAQGYGTAATSLHALYTLSTTAGSRVAFYFPKLCVTNVPVQFDDFLARVHPDDVSGVRAYHERAHRERSPSTLEYRIVRPSGDTDP